MSNLTPMPTCAVDPLKNACPHDRIEPMWDIDLAEETGNPGPMLFCCIAIRADELASFSNDALLCHWADINASLEVHSEAVKQPSPTPCELLHVANYAHDKAKLETILRERGVDPSTFERELIRMGIGPRA